MQAASPRKILKLRPLTSIYLALATCATVLLSCDNKNTETTPSTEAPASTHRVQPNNTSEKLWSNINEVVNQASSSATALSNNVDQLLNTPSAQTLAAAQQQWKALEPKLHALNYLFHLNHSGVEQLSSINDLEFRLLAHPIQPGYLDSYGDYKFSGLVHDIGTTISAETLIEQHGFSDAEEAVLGLYPLYYTLFGEHSSRQVEDFLRQESLSTEQSANKLNNIEEIASNRRRNLLLAQQKQLNNDIETLTHSLDNSNPDRLTQRWREINSVQQNHIVLNALRHALAEAIVKLVDIQKHTQTHAQEERTEEEILPSIKPTEQLEPYEGGVRIDINIAQLESLQAGLNYLEPSKRENALSLLATSTQALENLDGKTLSTEKALAESYSALNELSKILRE
ncbi:MAG: putative iron-regulated protein [Flavobacteriales bacterium]|jgi:putative iron-regulated protein